MIGEPDFLQPDFERMSGQFARLASCVAEERGVHVVISRPSHRLNVPEPSSNANGFSAILTIEYNGRRRARSDAPYLGVVRVGRAVPPRAGGCQPITNRRYPDRSGPVGAT